MIKAVIFDMDGLLLDTEPAWQETEKQFALSKGIELSPESQKQSLGLKSIELFKYWHQIKPWPNPDFKENEKWVNNAMKNYYLNEAVLMNGSLEILEFFRKKKLKMALASSSPMMLIDTFLEKFKLSSYFTVKHSAEFEEYGKPHPGVYINAAAKLGVEPVFCLAIEDSFNGILAAKAARMKTMAVPESPHFNDAGFIIADMKLPSLLDFNEEKFVQLNDK